MARRGRKKKFKLSLDIQPETIRSVIAVVLILLGILSFISFLAPDYYINEKLQLMLRGLFGYPSVILAGLIIISGLVLLDSFQHKIKEPRVVLGLIILLFSLSGMFHVFISASEAKELAMDGSGGGLIGYYLSRLLVQALSKYGAVIALFGIVGISFLLIFDKSLDYIIESLSGLSEKFNIHLPKFTKKPVEATQEETTLFTASSEKFDENEDAAETYQEVAEEFEIIPSMSEPQGEIAVASIDDSSDADDTVSELPEVKMPKLPYIDKVWQTPPLDILMDPPEVAPDAGDINENAKKIKDTLRSFGINVNVEDVKPGPSVTQYALSYESGQTKISKITGLQNDLAMALASQTGTVRIEAPIPGKSLIGIEVPNRNRVMVTFKSQLISDAMKKMKSKLGIVLGKDVSGKTFVYDIAKMPHMLVAGATGSGKSVFIHNILFSILYRASPQEVKFILIDPKRVELNYYQGIPHLYCPVVTDMEKAPSVFKWAVAEMDRRYKLFEAARARDIDSYNEKSGFQALPYIVIIVDELAEIMVQDPAGVEKSIIRLAQLARATGIHLILALQRPSTNIITGLIKANITCRIAFNVASGVDSRVILDQPGAEKLLGKGDMLFMPPDNPKAMRLQGSFISEKEIISLVDSLKSLGLNPEYKPEILEMHNPNSGSGKSSSGKHGSDDVDELFDEAMDIVVSTGKASASLLQRRLSIGYTRAARILDELEEKGIIGPSMGSKARDILHSAPSLEEPSFDEYDEE